ncbi:MAG: M23 family metallopeptidase [Polaromonas sp.]
MPEPGFGRWRGWVELVMLSLAFAACTQAPALDAAPPVAANTAAEPPALLLPVQGIAASDLRDTFDDGRDGDQRGHEAIDILAPSGTPVLAVADGRIVKLFLSKPGGITIYQFDTTGQLAYYYAHLERYAEGLAEGQTIRRGSVIGYVGASGNASGDAPHLHFALFRLGPEKQWWKGEPINPFVSLGGREPLLIK